MKKLLSIILLIAILICSATMVFTESIEESASPKKITVGINAEFKPFEYYEGGVLKGFDVDLMNYIGERTGLEIEFVDMYFDQLFPAVMNGEVDCAISTMTVTQTRDQYVDFSRPYLKTCNITFENGQESRKYGEEYAIIFKEGLADSPYKELSNPTDDEKLYIMVDKALSELSNDRTVLKLIEKYELNKPLDESVVNIEYSAIMGGGDPAAKFEDLTPKISATSIPASEWAWADIDKAKALNIINYGGNYNFPGAITREKFCELVYNYICEFGEFTEGDGYTAFSDTDNMKIRTLNSMGIIYGKSETEFDPEGLLTREEAATILYRLINAVHPDLVSTELYFEFKDNEQISDWAMNAVQRICNIGIMNGVGNNCFAPKEHYTTEQAIVTLVRVYANAGISKTDGISFADKLKVNMPKDRNYMFSPLSIKMAFAMAANGAEGNTKTEILNTLGINDLDEYNEYAKKLIESYQKADILKLDIANSLWLNESNTSQKFSENYQNTLKTFYGAEAESSTKDKITSKINGWVKEKTNGKIDGIITDELAKDERFIMALLNAVYFKAAWQNEFNEKATKKDIFTDINGNENQTDFMNKTAHYAYYNTDGVEVLKLPYKNRTYDEKAEEMLLYDFDVSMYLIRGECSENALSELIENESLTSKRIQLSVPKFESEFDISLVNIMKNIGVVDAFIPKKSEFTKMFDNGNIYLMEALHKTYIKVDEKGTEAAAVTALAGGETSAIPEQPLVVKFDTPFTYVIRDDVNDEILFMGEYVLVE